MMCLLAVLVLGGAATAVLAKRHGGAQSGDVAEIDLVDQQGMARSLSRWRGKIIVLDFIYTGCGDTCPLKTAGLAALQEGLGERLRDRVQFVSVSIDPEHDDPAALRTYAARTGADFTNWAFLTGDLGKVARFAAAFDAQETPLGGPDHLTTVRLLDRAGHVVQRLVGDRLDEARLSREITALAAAEPATH